MTTRDALPAVITSARLTLRAPVLADLDQLVALADNWKVVESTAVMPFPYRPADGMAFLGGLDDPANPRAYAITTADTFMGVVSLKFAQAVPELGYWLGEPFWGKGFALEAVTALLGAVQAGGVIPRIGARVLLSNPASIRVLEKAGFTVTERTTSVVERHAGKPLLVMGWTAS